MRKRLFTTPPNLNFRSGFLDATFAQKIKEVNSNLARKSLNTGDVYVKAMPVDMNIETTLRCNLKCPMCQLQSLNKESLHPPMKLELFKKIAGECFSYLQRVSLSVIGEPLLSENLYEILDIIKSYSVKLELITNGVLLNNDDLILNLLEVLSSIRVSLDASSPETYNSIRKGGDFNKVIDNIKRFRELREGKAQNSLLSLSFVAMRKNIVELPEFVYLAKSIGADEVCVTHLIVFDDEMENESLMYHKDIANKYFLLAVNEAKNLKIHLQIPGLYRTPQNVSITRALISKLKRRLPIRRKTSFGELNNRTKCKYLWAKPFITAGGDVAPCCGNPGRPIIGNVLDQPFKKIWNNDIYMELRRSFLTGGLYDFCKNCTEFPWFYESRTTSCKIRHDEKVITYRAIGSEKWQAKFLEHNTPSPMFINQQTGVTIRARNDSLKLWESEHSNALNPIRLGIFWFNHSGTKINETRIYLHESIAPGQEFVLKGNIDAPAKPGFYRIKYDFVEEGIGVFSGNGGDCVSLDVKVCDSLIARVTSWLAWLTDKLPDLRPQKAGRSLSKFLKLQGSDYYLDIGSANGEFTNLLVRESNNKPKLHICLEEDFDFAKAGAKTYPNSYFVIGDAQDLPFKNSVFQKITAFQLFEHIQDSSRLMKELSRVSGKKALVLTTFPNSDVFNKDNKEMFTLLRSGRLRKLSRGRLSPLFKDSVIFWGLDGYDIWKKKVGHLRDGFNKLDLEVLEKSSELKIDLAFQGGRTRLSRLFSEGYNMVFPKTWKLFFWLLAFLEWDKIANLRLPWPKLLREVEGLTWFVTWREKSLVKFLEHNTPSSMFVNQETGVNIRARNDSLKLWKNEHSNSLSPVRLGVFWFNHNFVKTRETRIYLPQDVAPGQEFVLKGNIDAPAKPGLYRIKYDFLEEGTGLFSDEGGEAVSRVIHVRPSLISWFVQVLSWLGSRLPDLECWKRAKWHSEQLEFKKEDMYLDIGSGDGKFSNMVINHSKEKPKTHVCLEPDAFLAEFGSKTYPNSYFVIGDAQDLPFKNSVFQKITAFQLFEHIQDSSRLMKELSRVSGKKALVLTTFPNSDVFNKDNKEMFTLLRSRRLRKLSRGRLSPLFKDSVIFWGLDGYDIWKKKVGHLRDGFNHSEIKKLEKRAELRIKKIEQYGKTKLYRLFLEIFAIVFPVYWKVLFWLPSLLLMWEKQILKLKLGKPDLLRRVEGAMWVAAWEKRGSPKN